MKDIATRSTTSYILEKYHLQALKKYGQNFLIDVSMIEKIVHTASLDQDTCVIEIGPGIGALTQILARYAGFVQCYEIDQRFQGVYEEFLNQENINIIFEDFLNVDLKKEVKKLKQRYQKVMVVANVPYYITTNIIEKIVLSNSDIDSIIIMIQKEVAKKLTSDYKSPLTLLLQDMAKVSYEFTVSKHIFIPEPHVDSAIIKIKFIKAYDETLYHFLKLAFKQRRKTIYNNLKDYDENIKEVLIQCHIDPNKRSEQLSLNDFKTIIQHISRI